MTKQAGGTGAAISMAYQQGRHDGKEEAQQLIWGVMADITEVVEKRLEQIEDQVTQNKIVLMSLLKEKDGFVYD